MAALDDTDEAARDASSSAQVPPPPQQPPPLTARQRVFGIPELLEQILLRLGPLDLVAAQHVSRFWREVVTESSNVQEKMFPKRLMVEDLPRLSELLQDKTVVALMYPFRITRVAVDHPWQVTAEVQVAEEWICQEHERKARLKSSKSRSLGMIFHGDFPCGNLPKALSRVKVAPRGTRMKMTLKGHIIWGKQVPDIAWGTTLWKDAIMLDDMVTMFETACGTQCPCLSMKPQA